MKKYGQTDSGQEIKAPAGWKILPEGERVPQEHCEATGDGTWCTPRRCHSTMTPIYARVAGYVRAIAVPEGYEVVPKGATHVLRDTFGSDFDCVIQRVTYYKEFKALGMRLLKHWTGEAWAVAGTLPWDKLTPLQAEPA